MTTSTLSVAAADRWEQRPARIQVRGDAWLMVVEHPNPATPNQPRFLAFYNGEKTYICNDEDRAALLLEKHHRAQILIARQTNRG